MVDTTEPEVLSEKLFALLDLPNFVLLIILQCLDVRSLCYASRTCTLLSKIAAHPSLWPHFTHGSWAEWDVRCTLARIVRLPPQVFNVQLDVKRSRKFPVTVPLHNLRPLLNIADTEGLADRLSKAVQDKVHRLSAALWRFKHWQDLPPAASISVCRADRASVRASLRADAVVPRLLHNLQQLGWPPTPEEATVLVTKHTVSPEAAEPAAAGNGQANRLSHNAVAAGGIAEDWGSAQQSGTQGDPPEQHYPSPFRVTASWRVRHPNPVCRTDSPWQVDHSSTGPSTLLECLQVCHARCELLSADGLPQLHALRGHVHASTRHSTDHQERSYASLTTAAAAGRLPDESVSRETAAAQLQALGMEQQAARLISSAAVRLLYASAAADPSMLAFALPGKPGWLIALEKSVKILARFHTLQQVCLCNHTHSGMQEQGVVCQDFQRSKGGHRAASTAADTESHSSSECLYLQQPPSQLAGLLSTQSAVMHAAWHVAGDRELQLCLAGFHEFVHALSHRTITAAHLYRCAQSLEAAASEYASEGAQLLGSDSVTDAIRRMGLMKLQVEQEERQVMQKVLQLAVVHAFSGDQLQPEGANILTVNQQPVAGNTDNSQLRDEGKPTASVVEGLPHQMLVRCAMHIELLRSMSWCLWLLGVL